VVRPCLLSPIVARAAVVAATCLFVLLHATPATAQKAAPAAQGITATRFIEQVAANNPRLTISEADVDAAAAQVRAAGLWQNPTIAYDREEVFEAGQGMPENFMRLELPIQVSGRRSLMVDSAEKGATAARADAKVERVALIASAMRAYLQAAALREQVSILEQSRGRLVPLRDSVRARASAGDASGYDLTRIEVELSSLDALITDAERDLTKSQLALGLWAGSPGARLDATDELSVQSLAVVVPTQSSTKNAITIEAARARVSQHSLALDAAGRGWVPSLTLTGGARTAPSSGDTAWGYVAGVALTLPIFDLGQADKQMSEAALRRARANLLATEHRTKTRVAMAHESFNQSLQQATTFERDQLPRLEQLLRRAEVSYKEGERPVFELLDAHRTHREVRLRNIQLKLQARLGHVELLEALGQEPGGIHDCFVFWSPSSAGLHRDTRRFGSRHGMQARPSPR